MTILKIPLNPNGEKLLIELGRWWAGSEPHRAMVQTIAAFLAAAEENRRLQAELAQLRLGRE